jgi:hypothetical protein
MWYTCRVLLCTAMHEYTHKQLYICTTSSSTSLQLGFDVRTFGRLSRSLTGTGTGSSPWQSSRKSPPLSARWVHRPGTRRHRFGPRRQRRTYRRRNPLCPSFKLWRHQLGPCLLELAGSLLAPFRRFCLGTQ